MTKPYKFVFFIFLSVFFIFSVFYFVKKSQNNLLLAEVASFLRKEKGVEDEILFLKEKLNLVDGKISQLLDTSVSLNKNFSKIDEIESLVYEVGQELEIINQRISGYKNTLKTSKNSLEIFDNNKEDVICRNFNQEPKKEIIFNEICWMGTESSARDEWLELKNMTEKEIDLLNWQIVNKDQKIKILLNGKISPNGFFLLERGDDDTLPNIEADLIFIGSLKNSNETLYLFDGDCNLQDIVIATSSWPAGDNKTKRTMERREDFSWQTSENIGGTPKAKNSKGWFMETEKEETEQKETVEISLIYPNEIFSQKEFEVSLSVKNLKPDVYDIKISILKISDETEQKRTISEISLEGEEWQSSYKYLTNVFNGTSFSGRLKLRIPEEFSGNAEILVKIRSQSKKVVGELKRKINIFSLPKTGTDSLPLQNFEYSQKPVFQSESQQEDLENQTQQENKYSQNFLQNEFFEEWQEGIPTGWEWGGSKSRISQTTDALIGNFSVEITLSTSNYTGFYQSGKEMNSENTYYASVWLKGKGIVKLGIKYPGSDYVYYSEEKIINSDYWTEINISRKPTNSGSDGGIKLNVKYDEEKGIPQNSKLIIGAAWLSNSPPPENWPK